VASKVAEAGNEKYAKWTSQLGTAISLKPPTNQSHRCHLFWIFAHRL
jgi:hypothetical protein